MTIDQCDQAAKDLLVSLGRDYRGMTNGTGLAVLAIMAGRVLATCPNDQRETTFENFLNALNDVVQTLSATS